MNEVEVGCGEDILKEGASRRIGGKSSRLHRRPSHFACDLTAVNECNNSYVIVSTLVSKSHVPAKTSFRFINWNLLCAP